MKFHNCNIGIFAKNGSVLNFNSGPHYIRNITNAGIQLESDCVLSCIGSTSQTGSSFVFETNKYGIAIDSAKAFVPSPSFTNCQYSIFARNRGFFNADYSVIQYGGTASTNAGCILDMNSVGSVYGINVSGHTSSTGAASAATFKVVNDSILYVGLSSDVNRANTTPYGTVRLDTYQGLNAGGFITVNQQLAAPDFFD
jgi:hypothetical protein